MTGLHRRFARTVAAVLAAALTALSVPAPASARLVGTEEVARAESDAAAPLDRAGLVALLERTDVREQLEALGVDPRQARERVDALTDEEVGRLAGQLGALPAGAGVGSLVGVLFAVFIVLLVTDILGLTRVFPFTRPVR